MDKSPRLSPVDESGSCWFETHQRHWAVPMSKTNHPLLSTGSEIVLTWINC